MKVVKLNIKISTKLIKNIESLCTYFVVTCSALALSNGMISYNGNPADDGRYPVNTTATFTCNDEYYLDGDITGTCESSGSWSQESICRGK